MKKGDKKGLSAVVATLLILLLVIVAIGIIWAVANSFVTQGAETLDVGSKCLQVNLELVGVTETAPGDYRVTMKRVPPGDGEIGGIKIVMSNGTDYSEVKDFGVPIAPLQTEVGIIDNTNVTNANKLETTIYYLDASGNEVFCQQTSSFTF